MPTIKLQIQEDQRTLSRINTKQTNKQNRPEHDIKTKDKEKPLMGVKEQKLIFR